MSYRSASRIESGASSATPADPSAPAIAGSDATTNTTHGIERPPPLHHSAAPSTIRSTVPFAAATPKRYVTPTSRTNRSTGKPANISRGVSPATNVPTRYVITRPSAPRLIGRSVPTTKIRISPARPAT